MTKQQNKLHHILTTLEGLILLGSIILNVLSKKKMGLMRHLTFRNYQLDQSPIKVILILLLFLFLALELFNIRKKKIKTARFAAFSAFFLLSLLLLAVKLPFFPYDFYYQSILFLLLAGLEMIKTLCKKGEGFSS